MKTNEELLLELHHHGLVYICRGSLRVRHEESLNSICITQREMIFLPKPSARTLIAQSDTTIILFKWPEFETLKCHPPLQDSVVAPSITLRKDGDEQVLYVDDSLDLFFSGLEQIFVLGLDDRAMHQVKCQELFLVLKSSMNPSDFIQLFCSACVAKHDHFKRRIQTHALEAKTLAELIERMGMSRAHFHRVFREAFGVSPYKWMLAQKAEEVREHILQSQDPLKVIAQDLGFGSHSNLNAFCIKFFGMTAKNLQKTRGLSL